jgi:predicted nucleotidyltransferase
MARQLARSASLSTPKSAQALKGELAARIVAALERQGLTVREAQAMTGQAAADFSRLRGGQLERFTIERLLGSVLREDLDPDNSDIDLTVEFARSRRYGPADQYFKFKTALEQLFGHDVDLIELRAMPASRLKQSIERSQVPVYEQAA